MVQVIRDLEQSRVSQHQQVISLEKKDFERMMQIRNTEEHICALAEGRIFEIRQGYFHELAERNSQLVEAQAHLKATESAVGEAKSVSQQYDGSLSQVYLERNRLNEEYRTLLDELNRTQQDHDHLYQQLHAVQARTHKLSSTVSTLKQEIGEAELRYQEFIAGHPRDEADKRRYDAIIESATVRFQEEIKCAAA